MIDRDGCIKLSRAKKKVEYDDASRQKFYLLEEKKLEAKEEELKRMERKSRIERKKAIVLRHIQKELQVLKKRNEISLGKLMKLMKMHDQSSAPGDWRRDSHRTRSELSGKLRSLQLSRMKEAERIRTLTEVCRLDIIKLQSSCHDEPFCFKFVAASPVLLQFHSLPCSWKFCGESMVTMPACCMKKRRAGWIRRGRRMTTISERNMEHYCSLT